MEVGQTQGSAAISSYQFPSFVSVTSVVLTRETSASAAAFIAALTISAIPVGPRPRDPSVGVGEAPGGLTAQRHPTGVEAGLAPAGA
jgi:hypothetical protein